MLLKIKVRFDVKIGAFAGHREVYAAGMDARIATALNAYLKTDTSFLFYTGGMGEFDRMCASAVRTAQRQYPELSIRLVLVLPYMTNKLNTDKDYYEYYYDDVIIPEELAEAHYKSAITARNRWMIDRADFLLAFVQRSFGGAYTTLRYAEKQHKAFLNLAAKTEESSENLHI